MVWFGWSFVRPWVGGCGLFGKVGSFQSLDFSPGKPLNALKVGLDCLGSCLRR